SSIHQNAGKTTISIGLFHALKQRRLKTTFMKPVGQEVVEVGQVKTDKDSYLFSAVFKTGRNFKTMNPITIGRGYTEKYIAKPHKDRIGRSIKRSFNHLTKNKDAIIVEGTGHAGVGAVIDYSNADVAKLLGSKTVIVSEGGIGKSIDEIILNKALFDLLGVPVLGVVINKVRMEKYEKIQRTLSKGLAQKGIRLLGVIPADPLLSSPTVDQIKTRLGLQLMSGKESVNRRVKHAIVAAMEPHNMIHYLQDGTLVITSGDRVDNILLAVSSHLVRDGRSFQIAGIILTGDLKPNPEIIDLLKKSNIPVLNTQKDTYTIAGSIEHLICKIQKTDKDKIEQATRLVQKYVDVDAILESF
ncbi:MAG: AAA family ATPase, partial [Candidatus Omnitrophica bacterium]|nr:AAA family ATPase [Candidatus Omnitrophota bacterium]